MKKAKESIGFNLKKVCCWFLGIYMAAVLVFYYAAGQQLFIRDSKYNIKSVNGELATGELLQGNSAVQIFQSKMDELCELTIRLATFGRQNAGNVIIRLFDNENGALLWEQPLDTGTLQDSVYTHIKPEKTIEGLRNRWLRLEILSSTGVPGNAIAPWYGSEIPENDWQFYFNGQPVSGTLCFEAFGRDLVWTGPHYWLLAGSGALLLFLYCINILYQEKRGKKSLVVNALVAFSTYRFLMEQLVARDFKTKYKRSVLGVFWSFLNPLLTMLVQYIVFSTIFKSDIKNYPVYLLIGIVLFGFFSEACGMSLMSILGNASLITKVYVPKYIYPVTRVLSSSVNLFISLLPLTVMILFTGTQITRAYLLLVFPLLCLVVFCIGIAFLLSSAMVFFRDTQFLWGIFSMLWMYCTPIFYPESILPPGFSIVHKMNPMYYFIKFFRIVIIDGVAPEPRMFVACALFALAFLSVGAFVFKKSQDKFVFYI